MSRQPLIPRPHPARLLAWWILLFALWLLFAGQWSWLIALWGAGLALVAAFGGEVVAGQELLSVRWRPGWFRELGPALAAVVVDFLIVTRALAVAIATGRRRLGEFREDRSTAGPGKLSAGRRAWIELVTTWSPNCYVLDIDPETGRRLLHDLEAHRVSEQPR
ncbi:MAG: hypothetical protein M3319_15450 [Actinomycetota bacterium]|nr:hypothetical protein [Actinomycetota bacterium]MDQ3901767.1 hypothetical protein [Actinomycetota bacterium]